MKLLRKPKGLRIYFAHVSSKMFWEIAESRSTQINCNILFLFMELLTTHHQLGESWIWSKLLNRSTIEYDISEIVLAFFPTLSKANPGKI